MTKTTLTCPKCKSPMRALRAGDAHIERCEGCFGIWLDKGERTKLMASDEAVAGLDVGSPAQGEAMDEIRIIDCPRCQRRMMHVDDAAQKHVGFEICPDCHGSFFDAGELTDLSEFTLSERIKAFFGR